jgi:cytidine deaminase
MNESALSPILAKELVSRARAAAPNAYAPYSGLCVGAALLTDSGSVYVGCNVENASYPAGICAERSAAAQAISHGERGFRAIAIAAPGRDYCSPCGICRQFLTEFAPEMEVFLTDTHDHIVRYTLSELLPHAFEPE